MNDETSKTNDAEIEIAAPPNDAPKKVAPENPISESAADFESKSRARRTIYNVLIVLALGAAFGKIIAVDSVPDRTIQNYRLAQIPKTLQAKEKDLREKGVSEARIAAELKRVYVAAVRDASKARPSLSANDRSRWLTIRALVEPESRVYRYVPAYSDEEKSRRVAETPGETRFRYSADEILRNCASDCPERFEKSKMRTPKYERQLVPFAIDKAWETPGWDSIDVVKHGLADEIYSPENPASGYLYSSKPPLLPAVMAAPYWVLNRCFGLSLVKKPFETTRILLVIYHLIPLGIAFFCLASVVDSIGKTDWGRFYAVSATTFGTFVLAFAGTLNNHLPGFVCVSIALWATFQIVRGGKTGAWYFACAGFWGAFAVVCELPALALAAFFCGVLLWKRPKKTLFVAVPLGLVVAGAFFATNYVAHQTFKPAYSFKRDHMKLAEEIVQTESTTGSQTTANKVVATRFDPSDWYYYNYYPSGQERVSKNARLSHWANRTGVDRGEPSIGRYAFHSTIGLRGVFSLTPIWIFAVCGFVALLARKPIGDDDLRWFGWGGLALTAIFFAFFLTRDQGDRNYGGASCCPRWFFPLIPLFIPALLPIVDKASRSKIGRFVAYLALFISAASAAFPTWTPWTSPWLYDLAVDWNLTRPY